MPADGGASFDYYRWKRQLDLWGLAALNVQERRRPRMPNEIGPHLEQRIVAFSLAHPGFGPRRISAELAREKWGGIRDLRARCVVERARKRADLLQATELELEKVNTTAR